MASKATALLAVAAILAVATVGLVGCGPKPPCEVSPAQVDATKDACGKAQKALEEARTQRSALEADVSSTRAAIADLEGQPAELAARLETLKKGSGR